MKKLILLWLFVSTSVLAGNGVWTAKSNVYSITTKDTAFEISCGTAGVETSVSAVLGPGREQFLGYDRLERVHDL